MPHSNISIMFNFTLLRVCAEVFPRMNINVNINVLASVGAPLLDTQLHHVHVCTESAITLVQFIKHSKNNALWLHCSYIA